ncbi:MAG: winged helix-turn-helix domain-containing protein [Candidatus Nitrosocosmicus sp.]
MRCKSPEDINQQLSLLGNLFSHVERMGGVSVIHLTIKKEKEKEMRLFAKALKNAQLRNIFIIKLVAPQIISFNQTDLKIIKCLVLEPGMKILNVAKAISLSEKTVRKRLDRMAIHHILDFTLTLNPSAIRGYVFFGMIIRVESYRSQSIIEYIYSKFEEFLLRPPPPIINHGVIILVLYTSNFCVIEQILKKVESLEGVKEIEVFHAIRIRNSQE